MLYLESHETVTWRREITAATKYVQHLTLIARAIGDSALALTKYIETIKSGLPKRRFRKY